MPSRAAGRAAEVREERIELGVCVKCAGPRQRAIRLCDPCMAVQVQRTNEYKARHAQRGLCTDCTRPAARGFRHCQRCRERITDSYEKHRKTLGVIHFAPAPAADVALCGTALLPRPVRYSYMPHKATCSDCRRAIDNVKET